VVNDLTHFRAYLSHRINRAITISMEMRDGFGRPDPVTPDLMARRRSKLWAHPIVKQIVKEAPTKYLPSRTSLHECKAFQNGRPGKSSDNCAPQCMRECLNSRRGGFKASGRSILKGYH
jgi:hypothetical protein